MNQMSTSDIETVNTGLLCLYQHICDVDSRDQPFIRQALAACESFRNARTHNDYSGVNLVELTAAISGLYILIKSACALSRPLRENEDTAAKLAYSVCLNRSKLL